MLGVFISSFSSSFSRVVSFPFSTSMVIKRSLVFTSCPCLTSTLFTTPLTSEGISIDALSDSKTNIMSSCFIVCPTATPISLMVAKSIPSPRSGSRIVITSFILYCGWVWFLWVNIIFFNRLFCYIHFYNPFIC